nr:hypothetical protein [Legionella jordanis]
MAKFRMYTGSYTEFAQLMHWGYLATPSSNKEHYLYEIGKDLRRTTYYAQQTSIKGMHSKLLNTEHLDQDKNYSFTQGMFDGGVFGTTFGMLSKLNMDSIVASGQPLGNKSMRVCYEDDNGELCGLCITVTRNDLDESGTKETDVPLEERPLYYSISHIRGVTRKPEDREVTFITHPILLPRANSEEQIEAKALIEASQEVDNADIFERITPILNCRNLSKILEGAFDSETFSRETFEELDSRFISDHNIDNRDEKKSILHGYLEFGKQYLPSLVEDIQQIERDSLDIDFYKESSFQPTFLELYTKFNEAFSQIEDEAQQEKLLAANQLFLTAAMDVNFGDIVAGVERNYLLRQAHLCQARAILNNAVEQDPQAQADKVDQALTALKYGLHQENVLEAIQNFEELISADLDAFEHFSKKAEDEIALFTLLRQASETAIKAFKDSTPVVDALNSLQIRLVTDPEYRAQFDQKEFEDLAQAFINNAGGLSAKLKDQHDNSPKEPDITFAQRNSGTLGVGGFSVAMLITSVILVATGILAPLALITLGLAVAGAVGLLASAGKMAYNEVQFSNAVAEFEKDHSQHEQEVGKTEGLMSNCKNEFTDAIRTIASRDVVQGIDHAQFELMTSKVLFAASPSDKGIIAEKAVAATKTDGKKSSQVLTGGITEELGVVEQLNDKTSSVDDPILASSNGLHN